jgi:hypothetical protein
MLAARGVRWLREDQRTDAKFNASLLRVRHLFLRFGLGVHLDPLLHGAEKVSGTDSGIGSCPPFLPRYESCFIPNISADADPSEVLFECRRLAHRHNRADVPVRPDQHPISR